MVCWDVTLHVSIRVTLFWSDLQTPFSGYQTTWCHIDIDIDIFVNCNWVDTRWQYPRRVQPQY
jgi:hypothetical protein